ncbi:MAG TPA: HDOD domain-containing protein [Polyangia bacterium]|jgi:EAL and modified HD-GYP domain-containing signal transduction protein
MQVFVARQPIFDTRKRVVAYELLFRAGMENFFPPGTDPDMASAKVIDHAMSAFDFGVLTQGKKAYVNITRRVLCEGLYSMLPPKQTVIELLESVNADEETVAAARAARSAGYEIALDDFVDRPGLAAFVQLAQILKVDFLATPPEERRRLREQTRRQKITLLAEKVESAAEFANAEQLGYTLFQGYFFQRPEIISREDIPPAKLTYIRFLRALQAEQLDYTGLEAIIKQDVSLSVKLLKLLNSAAFGWRSRVTSLKHALVLLGERPFRKWASLIAVVGMTDDRPPELALVSLARARFCERLCPLANLEGGELDAFLVGLLSSLDAMMGRPLDELLAEVGVSPEIVSAVLHQDTPLGKVRALTLAYESGSWTEVSALAAALGIPERELPALANESRAWAAETLPR